MMQTTEHPWVTKARQKLHQRGFRGDRLDEELERLLVRFPFLRPKRDPNEALYRAINISKGVKNG